MRNKQGSHPVKKIRGGADLASPFFCLRLICIDMTHAIIVHNLEHARSALAVATELDTEVTLLSAPGAAAFLGATVFRDIIREAARDYPAARFQAVLDCGDEPGLALGAMRHGIKAVRITNPEEIRVKLEDIASQRGVEVYRDTGESLDLEGMTNPENACRSWIEGAS